MNSLHTKILSLVTTVMALTGPLQAIAAPPETIKAEFRVAATGISDERSTLWLRVGLDLEPLQVDLNIRTFSEPIKYEGLPKAEFYTTQAAARGAEPAETPLLSVNLQAGSSILVFVPREKTYGVLTIDGSSFPYGSFRFANLTKEIVRAEVGKEGATLPAGASQTFSFKQDQASLPVRLFSKNDEKGVRLLRQSNWSLSLAQRELVLFFVNPSTGLVQTQHLVDSAMIPPDGIAVSAP